MTDTRDTTGHPAAHADSPAPSAPPASVTLPLSGMSCAACATTIQRTLQQVPGVEAAGVNYATSRASVQFDPAKTTVADLVAAVRDVGYDVLEATPESREEAGEEEAIADLQERARDADYRILRRKLAAAVLLSAPIMVIAMAHLHFPGVNLGPARARRAGRRVRRLAVLSGRVGGPAPPERGHEHADCPRHRLGVRLLGSSSPSRRTWCRARPAATPPRRRPCTTR